MALKMTCIPTHVHIHTDTDTHLILYKHRKTITSELDPPIQNTTEQEWQQNMSPLENIEENIT